MGKEGAEYLGYADRIIVLSEEFRDLLSLKYPGLNEEKFVVFPNVPDLSTDRNIMIRKMLKNLFRIIFLYFFIMAL